MASRFLGIQKTIKITLKKKFAPHVALDFEDSKLEYVIVCDVDKTELNTRIE